MKIGVDLGASYSSVAAQINGKGLYYYNEDDKNVYRIHTNGSNLQTVR